VFSVLGYITIHMKQIGFHMNYLIIFYICVCVCVIIYNFMLQIVPIYRNHILYDFINIKFN